LGLGLLDRWAVRRVEKIVSRGSEGSRVASRLLRAMIESGAIEFLDSKTSLMVLAHVVSRYGDAWNVATGLRGPDHGLPKFKQVFTKAIRAGIKMIAGARASVPMVWLDDIVMWVLRVNTNHYHFLNHAWLALRSLSTALGDDKRLRCLADLARILSDMSLACSRNGYVRDGVCLLVFEACMNDLVDWMDRCSDVVADFNVQGLLGR